MSPNFTTTRWTVVLAAAGRDADTAHARHALENFCGSYWTPLYAFVRLRGCEPTEAQDAVQDFFLHLLKDQILAHAESQRGRFRTYLLRCFCNFLSNRHKKDSSIKRGGQVRVMALEEIDPTEWDQLAAAHHWSPELAYDITWAHALVERVVSSLRGEAVARGKKIWFDELRAFLPRGRTVEPDELNEDRELYQKAADRLGTSAETLRTSVHRLRARFRELVRAEVARTVETPEEIDAEFQHLRTTLSLAYRAG